VVWEDGCPNNGQPPTRLFIVSIIQNGMNFIGVDAYWQNIVFGLFILAAVAITVDRSTRGLIIK
jgi:ribose/xylose/arabinose/galactoside ABC-type transport system permease subunit